MAHESAEASIPKPAREDPRIFAAGGGRKLRDEADPSGAAPSGPMASWSSDHCHRTGDQTPGEPPFSGALRSAFGLARPPWKLGSSDCEARREASLRRSVATEGRGSRRVDLTRAIPSPEGYAVEQGMLLYGSVAKARWAEAGPLSNAAELRLQRRQECPARTRSVGFATCAPDASFYFISACGRETACRDPPTGGSDRFSELCRSGRRVQPRRGISTV